MLMKQRIVADLERRVKADPDNLEPTLTACMNDVHDKWSWTPPNWQGTFKTLDDFYRFLDTFASSTPADETFGDMFHGLYFVVSQQDCTLQKDDKYRAFQEWMALFVDHYGSYLNMAASANNLSSFLDDPRFAMEQFQIPPGGFNSFNTFFCRYLKPGQRPIGTETWPYSLPTATAPPQPLPPLPPLPTLPTLLTMKPLPPFNSDEVHQRMTDDGVITVPADSVFQICLPIDDNSEITVSKGNSYRIPQLLKDSKYANRFKDGVFTHSYLTPYTYHRYHTPVRGTVLEVNAISEQVYANVTLNKDGHLSAGDATGYQFKQDRGLVVIESPIGLVALVPIGMDFISSCNISVDEGDYLNKGDEFGYFLFGGSDMIMLFEKDVCSKFGGGAEAFVKHITERFQPDYLYQLGQVFADSNQS